jgi:hypothetical protein
MKTLKFLLASFVITLSVTFAVSACGCGGIPGETLEELVGRAVNGSTVVFQGKVTGFEYRKGLLNETGPAIGYETMVVLFTVDRWWKGDLANTIVIATGETRNADGTASSNSCEFHFEKGKNYLVFAGFDKAAALPRTNSCSLTQEVKGNDSDADGIYKFLGVGTPANKPKSSR